MDEDSQKTLHEDINTSMKALLEIRRRIIDKKEENKKENMDKLAAVLPLAMRAAIIYKCTSTMPVVNPTYLYTYSFMKDQFIAALRAHADAATFQSQQTTMAQYRDALNKLIPVVTNTILASLEKTMFATDFLAFAFYLAGNIALETKELTVDEWMCFLYGADYFLKNGPVAPNPVKNALAHRIVAQWWDIIGHLEKILPDVYKGVSQSILMHMAEWELWATSKTPHLSSLPAEFQKRPLKPFQRLLLMRAICPERVAECREWATANVLGDAFLQIKHPTIADVFAKETKVNKPLVLVKEEGEDPTAQILKLNTEEIKIECYTLTADNFTDIKQVLENCKKPSDKADHHWFFIKDIHTIPEFGKFVADKIKELTALIAEQHTTGEVNEKWFRLILSCNPCRLPRGVLNHSVRLAMNPPISMKQKVIRDLKFFQQQEGFATGKDKFTPQYRRLMLSLSILHAVLEKRNIFGTKAWSKPYILTQGELDVAGKLVLHVLDSFKDTSVQVSASIGPGAAARPQSIPWEPMRKVLSEICLGGRILEEYDLKTLSCMIDMYLTEDAGNGNYAFRENSQYRVPAVGTFPELLKHVEGFSNADDYELCGMTPDVTLAGQKTELENMLKSVQLIELRKNIRLEATAEGDETIIRKVIEQLPEHEFRPEEVNPAVMELKKGMYYGHNMFLLQEMERYNSMIIKMQNTTERIEYYLNSGELMPAALEKIYLTLCAGCVPEEFCGYPWTHSIGEWMVTLKKRIEYMRDWLKTGDVKGYWLRALIYPKGLFNAMLMYFAQRYEQKVEALSFTFEVTPYKSMAEVTDPQPQTVYLYDLNLINAKYNTETSALEELTAEETRVKKCTKMPVIAVTPTNEQQKEDRGDYECPVYYLPTKVSKVGRLENLVTRVDCPTELKSQYWILKEVFMSCVDPELNA